MVYTAGMDATAKPECEMCDKEIDGAVMWYAPLSHAKGEEDGMLQMSGTTSSEPIENSVPFHPKCFDTYRTGKEPPQEESKVAEPFDE